VGAAWRAREGGPGFDPRGTARAARRVRTVGRCRVTDERGPADSGSEQAERGVRRVGRPGKETGWGEPG
jgi:hypothetical protein